MSDNRIQWLDMFRGVAAIVVVLFHLKEYLGVPWMNFGFIAVDLFFILSGIVLSLRYAKAIEAGMGFPAFARVRLERLYPMAFIAGIFVVVMNVVHVPAGVYMTAISSFAWTLFLVAPLPARFGAGLAFPADLPMWSLWAELVANIAWFLVIRRGRRWMPLAGGVAIVGMLLLAWHFGTINYGWKAGVLEQFGAVVRAFAWFSIGVAIAAGRIRPRGAAWHWLALFAGVLVLYGFYRIWFVGYLLITIGALLLAALYHAPAPGPLLGRASHWLGLISYPIYVIHAPSSRLLPYVDGVMPRWLAVVVVIGTATVVATFVNEAAVRALQRWRRRRAAPVPAVARS